MNRLLIPVTIALVCGFGSQLFGAPWDTILFRDDFTGPDGKRPDANHWVINHPESWWWVQGRTFLPSPTYHPSAPFPQLEANACVIEHYQYNSYHLGTPKTTFLGGEIHTTMLFDPNRCYRFEARVRWPQPPRGLVSSFFTYGYDSAHGNSDEIDFEFLSNEVFAPNHEVLTNPWDESIPCPVQVPIPELDLTQWQVFRIYWCPDSLVEWMWVDPNSGQERLLRSETSSCIPDEGMNLYFNFWAPTSGWPKAYDANLVPDQEDHGVKYEYWIDYAEVRVPEPASCIVFALGIGCFLCRRRYGRQPLP